MQVTLAYKSGKREKCLREVTADVRALIEDYIYSGRLYGERAASITVANPMSNLHIYLEVVLNDN